MPESLEKRPSPVFWSIVLTLIALVVLAGLAACSTPVLFQRSAPEVEIIALGGGAVLPDNALGIRSSLEANVVTLDSDISVSPPVDSRTALVNDAPSTVLLDGLNVVRASADRIVLLNDISQLSATATLDTVSIAVRAVAEDDAGIKWLEVYINGKTTERIGGVIPPRPPVTQFTQDICIIINPIGSSAYEPGSSFDLPPGSHTITVIAQNSNGGQSESGAIALDVTYQTPDRQTWKAVTGVEACAAGLFPATTPLPDLSYTPPPPFTPTFTPTPRPVTPTPGPCHDNAELLTDVTVPDGALFNPGAAFVKTWRLRNTGTCPWDTRYQLVHVAGEELSPQHEVNVPQVVQPGNTVDISVPMVAPYHSGAYRSSWRLRNPDCGGLFGPAVDVFIRVCQGPCEAPIATPTLQPGPSAAPPPPSPANLTIIGVRPDGFDFAWTDTSVDEQGFRLYDANMRQAVASFPPNVTSGAIVGLPCGRSYSFYLVSFNERGESLPSNTTQASTGSCN